MKAIINGIILTPHGTLEGKALLFDDKVRGIVDASTVQADEIIDAQGLYVAPGLIDMHIHGYVGEDTSDGSEEGVRKVAKAILANGVTGFLPTTMTVSRAEIEAAFDVVRSLMQPSREAGFEGSEIIGCHAEGPFINPKRKGAQAEDHILAPDAQLVLPHRDVVKVVTMAPEMPGGIAFIEQVTKESDIVVSIGHTSATFEQALEAIGAGASHVTHLFNAMTGLTHREPGVVGAALKSKVSTELIADAFHVHPGIFSLVHGIKGDHLVLVTDCTRAGGLPDGEYTLGGQPIFVKGIECRLADGTIAGSVLHLNHAVRNIHELGGLPLHEAVHLASLSPAKALRIDGQKGSLEEGKDADIILMDAKCEVYRTIVRGTTKFEREVPK